MCSTMCNRCVIPYPNLSRSFSRLFPQLVWTSCRKRKRFTDQMQRTSKDRSFSKANQRAQKHQFFYEFLLLHKNYFYESQKRISKLYDCNEYCGCLWAFCRKKFLCQISLLSAEKKFQRISDEFRIS